MNASEPAEGRTAGAGDNEIQLRARGHASGDRVSSISGRLDANVEKLKRRPRVAIGSVEGKMEALTIHGKSAFVVHDAITGLGIECRFDRTTLAEVMKVFGKRLLVRGEIHYGSDGRPKTVRVKSFRELGGRPLPQTEDLLGVLEDDPISIDEWAKYVREK